MATYGLVDWDLIQWEQPLVFNLELMKRIVYLRNKRNLVKMLTEIDLERYSKIILHKDYQDDLYPKNIFNNEKVDTYGLAFTEGMYKPMEMEIEACVPDTSIYKSFRKFYTSSGVNKRAFELMLNGLHFRLSLDNETIWQDWRKQLPDKTSNIFSVMVHDVDITSIDGAYEILAEFLKECRTTARIGFKFPLNIRNEEDFIKWGTLSKVSILSTLNCFKIFNDTQIIAVTDASRQEMIYTISQEDFIAHDCQIFKQMVYGGTHGMKILLNITNPSGIWEKVVKLINDWSEYINKYQNFTVANFIKRTKVCTWLKVDVIEVFTFLQKNRYDLFVLFYECLAVVLDDNNNLQSRYRDRRYEREQRYKEQN